LPSYLLLQIDYLLLLDDEVTEAALERIRHQSVSVVGAQLRGGRHTTRCKRTTERRTRVEARDRGKVSTRLSQRPAAVLIILYVPFTQIMTTSGNQ